MKNLLLKLMLGVSLLLTPTTHCICANTDDAIAFDELKLGDWFILNQTIPSESIDIEFSTTWMGTVTNRTEQELTIELILTHFFRLETSYRKEGGIKYSYKYYTDTSFPYQGAQDEASDLISNPPKITITRPVGSRNTPKLDIELSDTLYRYNLTGYISGLKNTKKGTLGSWLHSELSINGIAQHIKPLFIQDKLSSLEYVEIKKASFKLATNTTISYKLNGYVESWVPQVYLNDDQDSTLYLKLKDSDTYSTSFHLDKPTKMVFKGVELWLSPGDSLVISNNGDSAISIRGKGSKIAQFATALEVHTQNIHNNLVYAYYDVNKIAEEIDKIEAIYTKHLYPNKSEIDPYWYQSAILSLNYIKSTVAFGNFSKPNLVENWDVSSFDSICPIIDYRYQPEFYHNFTQAFYRNQCALLNNNNLTNKGYWSADKSTFYLINQLFSGYMQSYLWTENLGNMLENEPISNLQNEISIFKKHCFDSDLTRKFEKLETHYNKLENGNNIKGVDADFVNLLPLKNSPDGYILLNITIFDHSIDVFSDIDSLLTEGNIQTQVNWVNIRGQYSKRNLTEEQIKERGKYGYMWLANQKEMDAYHDLNLATGTLLVLRNDGTIIGRAKLDSNTPNAVIDIILKDKEEVATAPLLSRTQLYVILLVLLKTTIIFGIIYKARSRKQKVKIKVSQLKLRAIRSQMNPHFIFNALTSIQSLILRGDIEQSNRYLTTFSRMLRNVLSSSDKLLIPLSSELELIEQHLQIEQLRMPISYNIEVANDINIDSIEIPGMLLQPIVENAVIHGLFPQQGGQVEIKLWLERDNLYCNIIDNGVGLKKSPDCDSNFGLYSIQERLTLLSDSKTTQVKLNISNRCDQESISGCKVEIIIPL